MPKQLNYIYIINPNHPFYKETAAEPLQICFRTNMGYEVHGRKMGYLRVREDDAYPVAER